MVGDAHKGDRATLKVLRDGQEQNLTVTLGDLSAEAAASSAEEGTGKAEPSSIGLTLAPLNQAAREQLDLPITVKGVMVNGVAENSPAAERGLLLRQSHLKMSGGFPATGFAWSGPNDECLAVDG